MGVVRGRELHLSDGYMFEGFRPLEKKIRGMFGGSRARILPLERRSKNTVRGVWHRTPRMV